MNLIIDIGNTKTKIAIFSHNNLVRKVYVQFEDTIENLPDDKNFNVIISSVRNIENDFINYFKKRYRSVMFLNSKTKVPLINKYSTPKTLGFDRIAAAVGANFLIPNSNLIIIDIGTALTIDFVNDKNEYIGGNISLGIDMRFKALNEFTDKLPLIKKDDKRSLIGTSTETAIRNGVMNGIAYEIEGVINKLEEDFTNINTFLTGGDAFFFDKLYKNNIFANANLVLIGLNRILEYNKYDKEI